MKIKKQLIMLVSMFMFCSNLSFALPLEHIYNLETINSEVQRLTPDFAIQTENGSRLVLGYAYNKQLVAGESGPTGVFILKLKPSEENPDSLVIDYFNQTFGFDNTRDIFCHKTCKYYWKQNGNLVLITLYPVTQGRTYFDSHLGEIPYITEFDTTNGEVVYSYADTTWWVERGLKSGHTGTPMTTTTRPPIYFPDRSKHNFIMFSGTSLGDLQSPTEYEKSLRYTILARFYDSLGNFIKYEPLKDFDTIRSYLPEKAVEVDDLIKLPNVVGIATDSTPFARDGDLNYYSTTGNIYLAGWHGTRHIPPRNHISFILKIDSDLRVLKEIRFPQYEEVKLIQINNEGNLLAFLKVASKKIKEKPYYTQPYNKIVVLDTSDLSIIRTYTDNLQETKCVYMYTVYNPPLENKAGTYYVFASQERNDPDSPYYSNRNEINYAAMLCSSDFQKRKFYFNPDKTKDYDFLSTVCERPDGKYEFWGSYGAGKIVRLVLGEEDFKEYAGVKVGIEDYQSKYPNILLSSSLSPNPSTEGYSRLNLNLEKSSYLNIDLLDLLGNKLFSIYAGLAKEGEFTKSFSTEKLSKGIYFLRISTDGITKTQKLIVNR